MQIRSSLYEKDGKALNNFEHTLPNYPSDLAKSIFKDPYNFDFLMLSQKVKELEIENLLTRKITHFLLELGKGFALWADDKLLNLITPITKLTYYFTTPF